MSSYSRPAQNGYWLFVLATVIVLTCLATLPRRLGGGLGKWLAGVSYLTESGGPTDMGHVVLKGAIYIGYFLMLSLPGPILGFSFGEVTDPVSAGLLIAGLCAVGYLAFHRDASGRSLTYRGAGIVPVLTRDKDVCAAALQQSPGASSQNDGKDRWDPPT